MFVLPLLLFPFILAAAVYRLYKLPRLYAAGTLRLANSGYAVSSVLTATAYIGLLCYTAYLLFTTVRFLLNGESSLSAWLAVAPTLAGYPVAYVAAEWVFYYGFRRPPK